MCACACMSMCMRGFRLCHRPHCLSNGFPGNSCQEASETPVKLCRRLFTALNPVTFPCEAERDMEGRETCFRFTHRKQEICRQCRQRDLIWESLQCSPGSDRIHETLLIVTSSFTLSALEIDIGQKIVKHKGILESNLSPCWQKKVCSNYVS